MSYVVKPELLLSKTDRVYNTMLERILAGQIPEGSHVKLGQIAEELGMSHVPVREAMRRLEADGYVEIIRNKGVRIRSLEASEYAMTLEALAVMEGAAAARGYLQLQPADLDAARRANDQMRIAFKAGDQQAFLAANKTFHALLVSTCPNKVMQANIDRLADRLTMIRNYATDFDLARAEKSCAEHDAILQAITLRRAASTIEREVRQHRMNSIRR